MVGKEVWRWREQPGKRMQKGANPDSGMLCKIQLKYMTQRKIRRVGIKASPMTPNKGQEVGEVKKTDHE
jgi:hypothetical protein